MSYDATRARVEMYFDRTAPKVWAALTSDAPVSRIRQTVRAGRDEMRAKLLAALPSDLTGASVLDAGCGAGQMTIELARRGAKVVAVDISPTLIGIAKDRLPAELRSQVRFAAGDMLAEEHGSFDHVIAMDSLIYYTAEDIHAALSGLSMRVGQVVFTVAPRNVALMTMFTAGKVFPRADRSPVMIPHAPSKLMRHLSDIGEMADLGRVNRGFYISQALELRP